MRASGFSIGQLVETILRSRLFHSPIAHGARVKSPVEWCVGVLRALDVPRPQVRLLAVADSCGRQGQSLFAPPGVNGWEWGSAWLTSAALIERTNWTARILWGSDDYGIAPIDLEARFDQASLGSVRELLLAGGISAATERVLATVTDDDRDSILSRVHAMLSTPEFHLA